MKEILELPEDVKAEVNNSEVKITGKLGDLTKTFIKPEVKKEVKGNTIILTTEKSTRSSKRMIQTYRAHILNMIKGVTEGFEYKLKAVFTHFPMTVKIENDKIRIDNFIGERSPRFARIMPGAEVKIAKQDITITGIDIDAVAQTAGNLENKSKVIGRDRRIFQDGIYITKKVDKI